MDATDPTTPCQTVDDIFSAALRRARAEFVEMPGLRLTLAQASRLWAVDGVLCQAVLDALVEARFLMRARDASFIRT